MTVPDQETVALSGATNFPRSSRRRHLPVDVPVPSLAPSQSHLSIPSLGTEALPQRYSPQKSNTVVAEAADTNFMTINGRASAEATANATAALVAPAVTAVAAATIASVAAVFEDYNYEKGETSKSTESCDDSRKRSACNRIVGRILSLSIAGAPQRPSPPSFQEADDDINLKQPTPTSFVVDRDTCPNDGLLGKQASHTQCYAGLRSIPVNVALRTDKHALEPPQSRSAHECDFQEPENFLIHTESAEAHHSDAGSCSAPLSSSDVPRSPLDDSRTPSETCTTSKDAIDSPNWTREDLSTKLPLMGVRSESSDISDDKEKSPISPPPDISFHSLHPFSRESTPIRGTDNGVCEGHITAINLSQIATDVSSPPSQSQSSPHNDISTETKEDVLMPNSYPTKPLKQTGRCTISRLKRARGAPLEISKHSTIVETDSTTPPLSRIPPKDTSSPDKSPASYLSDSPPPAPQTPKGYEYKGDHESSASDEVPFGAKRNQTRTSPTSKTHFRNSAEIYGSNQSECLRPPQALLRKNLYDTFVLPGSRGQNDRSNRKTQPKAKNVSHPAITPTTRGRHNRGQFSSTPTSSRKSPRLSERARESVCANSRGSALLLSGKTSPHINETRQTANEDDDRTSTKRRLCNAYSKSPSMQEGSEPTKRTRRTSTRLSAISSERKTDPAPPSNSRCPSDVMRDLLNAQVERGDIDVEKARHIVDKLNVPDPSDSDSDAEDFKLPIRRGRGRPKRMGNVSKNNRQTGRQSKHHDDKAGVSRRKLRTRRNTSDTEGEVTKGEPVISERKAYEGEDENQERLALKIVVKPLKTGNRRKKEFPERMFTTMESEELSTLRIAFEAHYPQPPSNLQAQASFERAYGMEMTPAMIQGLWKKELQPWSDRWWNLYHQFNDEAREEKKKKPRHTNPVVKMSEAKRWAKDFHERNGPARIQLPNSVKFSTSRSQLGAFNENTTSCSKMDSESVQNGE